MARGITTEAKNGATRTFEGSSTLYGSEERSARRRSNHKWIYLPNARGMQLVLGSR